MCHYKTSADRLHVIIVTIEIAILYSLASCLIRFPFLHNAFRSLHGVLYALPIVHDTSSKNARRPLQRHFRDVTLTPSRITDITLSRMTLGKCRLLLLYFRVVTIIPARITDITLSRMTLVKCRLLQGDVTLTPTRIMDITLSRMTLVKCRLLQGDVTLTPTRIMDKTLWRKCLAPAATLYPGFCTLSLGRKSKS